MRLVIFAKALKMADVVSARLHASQHVRQAAVSLIRLARTRKRASNLKVLNAASFNGAAFLTLIDGRRNGSPV